MRAVLDTNVIVSGVIKEEGPSGKLSSRLTITLICHRTCSWPAGCRQICDQIPSLHYSIIPLLQSY